MSIATLAGRHRYGGGGTEAANQSAVYTVGPTMNASINPGSAGSGNLVAFTAGGAVTVNGTSVGGSAIIALYYINHSAYCINSSNVWSGPISISGIGSTVAYQAPAGTFPPAVAIAQGYTVQTLGPNITLNTNWWAYFRGASGASITQNGNGSITLAGGNNSFNAQITTIQSAVSSSNFVGIAFGGGGYYEVSMSIAGFPINTSGGWPAFWANDIELQATGSVTAASQWPGQASNYGDWIEVDFLEFDVNGSSTQYGNGIINWYNTVGSNNKANTTFSAVTPAGAVFTNQNKWGFLWTPATPGVNGSGSGKFYFNNTQEDSTTWNPYNSALAPPPATGSTAFSVLDSRHIFPILGSGPNNPITCFTCSVWQASSANNLNSP